MRILLTNHFPFEGSATGTATHDLAIGLLAAGHEVRVLIVDQSSEGDEPFPVRRVVCGGESSRSAAELPFDLPSFTTHSRSHLTYYGLTDEQVALYRDALREAIDDEVGKFDPQIIHVKHLWVQSSLVLETGVPYVASAQETNLAGYQRDPRYQIWAEQGAQNAGCVIADSAWMASEVRRVFHVDADRVATVPSGIDLRFYQGKPDDAARIVRGMGLPPSKGPLIVFAGKLVESQGVDVLLEAAKLYESQWPGSQTVIVGDGPELDRLEARAKSLHLARTHFLGHREREEHAALYKRADLVVIPSRTDPFELVAIEALASGTPVLATEVGSIPELIRTEIGGLSPVGDAPALAALVDRAIREGWKQKKGPAAAAYAAREHGMEQWVRQIAAVYDQVLERRFG